MRTGRYLDSTQAFEDIDVNLYNDLGVPTHHQLRSAADESNGSRLWPVRHYVSFFLAALVIACYIISVVNPMAAIVACILPGTPGEKQDTLKKRLTDQMPESTLSSASASWALVAIATNTMCQPFGKVLDLPAKHSFALRASPIVCTADSLEVIISIVRYSTKTRSLFEGISLTVQNRFQDVQPNDSGSFAALRDNTVFRALLFLLGALPQAIKLYAVRGAYWTQILAGIYLSTFLLSEIAAGIARRDRVEQAPNNISFRKSNRYRAIATWAILAVSVSFVYLFFTAAIFTIMRDYWTLTAWPLILSACLINICYVCSIVASKRDLLILCSGPLVPVSGASLSFALSPAVLLPSLTNITPLILSEDRQQWLLLSGIVLIAVAMTTISFYRLMRNVSSRYARYVHFELDAYYFLVHLVTLFLGSAFLYDPTPTYKPSWTDVLG